MNENQVSIIMPVYNVEKYLVNAIESVLEQSYSDWELLAVDDCSTDKSREILQKLASSDSRIRPIFLNQNIGAARARNEAIRRANGRYLAFLDSDDIWIKDKLMKQIQIMKENRYAFTFTSYSLIDTKGNQIPQKVTVPERITYTQALTHTVIWTCTVMLDLRQTGSFEMTLLESGEDTATWLQLLKKVSCAYGINQIYSLYRQVPGSLSHSIKRRLERQWRVYRTAEQFSIAKSLLLYARYVLYVLNKRKRMM